ncbi:CBO0543 family protein [Bacillus sp. 31A1R]|uniref:CBO0543 family protein n=1 Tax=Robertmurraya mangrovi TaxID=3098077 RepID=A0ABU5J0C9_9BACI|nr:CBO0543 family protein [Bacillus sp. 31A1R]MDZ5472875.1 CBO0543 family protein [Bacillus sp. 31A1R]
MTNQPPTYEEIRNVHQQLFEMKLDYWISHDLFSFQWWLLLFVLLIPWLVWWKFVDKQRINEILLFGTTLMIIVMILDDLGVELHLWSYPYQLVNILPRLIAVDQGIIIIAHMFVYQFFRKWKPFLIANLIMASIFTFIFEPLTVWLGIYKLENWRYIYSLPIYILKASVVKGLVDKIIKMSDKPFRASK